MLDKVYKYVNDNRILTSGDSVVLGVSGGADSVCLLIVMSELSKRMKLTLTAVHVNHCLRGDEADGDMEYVRELCGRLGVACFVYRKDIAALADEMKCSTEEAGRVYRYKKFEDTMEKVVADKIAVAHNMNDSSETFLLNLFRGTGIKGLCGIPVMRGNIIRPLLCADRSEIETFLNERHILYRVDSTNLTDGYTRNKIRRNILPYAAEEINARAAENICKAAGQLGEIEDYLTRETEKAKERIITDGDGRRICLDEAEWNITHNAIRKRIIRECIFELSGRLKDITETHIELIMGLWRLGKGKQLSFPYDIYAVRTDGGIEIRRGNPETLPEHLNEDVNITINMARISEIPTQVVTPAGIFEVSYEMPEDIGKIPDLLYTKWFNCGKINNDLQIRTRREGDWLEIDGKGGKKKLKSFFIDSKIPKEERGNILLVADGSHILWIVGYRISNGVKVDGVTDKCIKIKYKGERFNER